MIACTGWTWEYIDDHMTLPRLKAMTGYWASNPPLHVMVAAFFGVEKPQKTAASNKPSEAELEELMRMFPMA